VAENISLYMYMAAEIIILNFRVSIHKCLGSSVKFACDF